MQIVTENKMNYKTFQKIYALAGSSIDMQMHILTLNGNKSLQFKENGSVVSASRALASLEEDKFRNRYNYILLMK
jgi:hypothetical protein